jgi:hypothetical protein
MWNLFQQMDLRSSKHHEGPTRSNVAVCDLVPEGRLQTIQTQESCLDLKVGMERHDVISSFLFTGDAYVSTTQQMRPPPTKTRLHSVHTRFSCRSRCWSDGLITSSAGLESRHTIHA